MDVRPSTREIVFAGGREVLEPRVMAVLVVLARAGGEVVTRDDLTMACWDGRVVSDDAINRVISRIRRASDLTQGRDFKLETITKVGYRLVASERGIAEAPKAPDAPGDVRRKRGLLWPVSAVAALAVVVATGAWWLAGRQPEWTPDPTRSLTLAVLPFDNLSSTAEDQPLALGMAREIRNTLSRVRGLRVVSDASSFALASEPLVDSEISRRLGADLLLDGSLTRTGDTIRISVELVDGWKAVNLWTGSESGPAADLDRLRQEISADVVEQLVLRLGPTRVEALAAPRRGDGRVYRMAVEASELLEGATKSRMRGEAGASLDAGERANKLIDQALAIEPESPIALRLKAQIISMGVTRELYKSDEIASERAAHSAEYLRRALTADPDSTDALAALGEYYRRFEWRWDEARTMLERAIALDPNSAEARLSYAYYLSGAGRCLEALAQSRTALEIDPEFGWRTLSVPRALKCLGRYEEADAAYLKTLEQDPGNIFVLREVYLNKLVRGDADGLDGLRTHVRDVLHKGKPSPDVQSWLDWTAVAIDALRGKRAPFLAMLEKELRANGDASAANPLAELNRRRGDISWIFAVEFAVAGAPQRSIDMLQIALSASSLYIPETMPYGAFEFSPEVRSDPRYQALWRTDPRLAELSALRLQAVKDRQMAGALPDGTRIVPNDGVDTRS